MMIRKVLIVILSVVAFCGNAQTNSELLQPPPSELKKYEIGVAGGVFPLIGLLNPKKAGLRYTPFSYGEKNEE